MSGSTKLCPFCAEEVKAAAIICKHCKSDLSVARPVARAKKVARPSPQLRDAAHEKSAWSGFLGFLLLCLEVCVFCSVLAYLYSTDVEALQTTAGILALVFLFTVVTGIGVPHFQHRGKALLFLCLTIGFALSGQAVLDGERELRLAELRESDPQAYLEEVKGFDEERWFDELPELDPDAFAEEQARRLAIKEAERLAECSDKKVSLAYAMIQSDVRRALRSPSTAEFPGRYGTGTGHLGNCIYQVVGTFDAQNGFGTMIRGRFVGTTEYFPESRSWQTRSLDVQG